MNLARSSLHKDIEAKKVAQAYLAPVRAGTDLGNFGKRLAGEILCSGGDQICRGKITRGVHPDLIHLTPEKTTISINQVREIQRTATHYPVEGERKVYLVNKAEDLSIPAANSLLKILETPPPFVVFILLSVNSSVIPATIVSRCRRLPLGGLSRSDWLELLVEQDYNRSEADYLVNITGGKGSLIRQIIDEHSAPIEFKSDFLKRHEEDSFPELCDLLIDEQDPLQRYEAMGLLINYIHNGNYFEILQIADKLSRADRQVVSNLLVTLSLVYRNLLLDKTTVAVAGKVKSSTDFPILPRQVRKVQKAVLALENHANVQLQLEALLLTLNGGSGVD